MIFSNPLILIGRRVFAAQITNDRGRFALAESLPVPEGLDGV
jgi:hypothetical protein